MSLPLDQIICHDVAKGLPLSDECIDVVITSPPYWGLRDYGASVQSVFGGDPKCKHRWGDKIPPRNNKSGKHGPQSTIGAKKGQDTARRGSGNQFCQRCGAWRGQLGLEPHPQMYVDHLVQICKEIKRVLKKTGSFYLNLGDTYYGSGGAGGDYNEGGLKEGQPRYRQGKSDGSHWLQPKQLMMIPSRVAIALQDDGWILRNFIPWHKINHMPSSVKDRLASSWEPVFYFVKSRRNYFDLDAIREPHKAESLVRASYDFNVIPRAWKQEAIPISGGKDVIMDCHPGGKNPGDVLAYNTKYEREHGQSLPAFYREQSLARERGDSKIIAKKLFPGNKKKQQEYINMVHDHGAYFVGKNPSDFWSLTTQPFTGYSADLEHFAVFPEDLVVRPLLASCPRFVCRKCGKPRSRISEKEYEVHSKISKTEKSIDPRQGNLFSTRKLGRASIKNIHTVGYTDCGCNADFNSGIVLDPFCGRGTVGKVAKQLGLHYILIDIKPEYCELARLYIAGQKYKLQRGQKKLKTL